MKNKLKTKSSPPLPLASDRTGFGLISKLETIYYLIDDVLAALQSHTFSAGVIDSARAAIGRIDDDDDEETYHWLHDDAFKIVQLIGDLDDAFEE
jgi:hypothetical protein